VTYHIDDLQIERELASCNPVALGALGDTAASQQGEALLQRIITGTPPPARSRPGDSTLGVRPRRLAVTAVGLAAAVVGVFVLGLGAGSGPPETSLAAYVATPPMLAYHSSAAVSAAPTLTRMAERVARQRVLGGGSYSYMKVRAWGLSTTVSGHHATSVVVPQLTEQWTGPDGQVRQITSAGPTVVQRPGSPETDKAAGAMAGVATTDAQQPLVDVSRLSANPAVLARQLVDPVHQIIYLDPAESVSLQRLEVVLYLYRQQALSPQLQSGMWRVLAASPGFRNLGVVTDRAGRDGVAVALDDNYRRPTRYVLIFDPRTGRLLGDEQIITTVYRPGQPEPLNVRIPAVIDYHAYLTVARVPTVDARP